MSYLDPILKSLNLIPQDAKAFDSKDVKAGLLLTKWFET